MKIDPKYKDANENQKAIAMLPVLITFLGNVSKEDNISLNDSDAAKSLTKLADEAERLKFLMGYGY